MIPLLLEIIPSVLPGNVVTAAILLGIAYAVLTLKLQRKLSHPHKIKEQQAKIKQLTKEINEMAKRKEDYAAKQAELMPLIKQSMSAQFKSMFVILPLFFVIYYGVVPMVFAPFNGDMVTFFIPMTYSTVFFFTIVVAGLILGLVLSVTDKRAMKRKVTDTQATVQQ